MEERESRENTGINDFSVSTGEHDELFSYCRANTEAYKKLFSDEITIVLLINPKNNEIIDANNTACEYYGWKKGNVKGKNFNDITVFSDEKSNLPDFMKPDCQNNFLYAEQLTANGKIRDVKVYTSPLIEDEELKFYVVQDITEEKRTEEQIQLTNFSLYNFSDPVFWTDSDGHFFYVNKAACDHLGYSEEELLTMCVMEIDPDFTADIWKEHWEEIKEKKAFTFESRHRVKSGKIIPVEITANHMVYNEKEYNCAFVKDISERKKAEKRLQLSCFSLENFVDPVAWINNKAEFIYVNQAACDLLGYTKKELLSFTVFDISFYTPDIWEGRWNEIKTNKKSRTETYFKKKAGESIPVSISSTYMNYEGKEYICVFAMDITERKKAEKDLHLSFFSLENCYDPVYWIKSNGQIFYVNKTGCDLLGYSEKELLSMSVSDVNPNFSPEIWKEHWKDIKSEKIFFSESTLRTRSGEILPVEITASYLNYEGEEYHCAFIRDISERKKHEKALAEEVNWRRSLMNGSRDGIVVLDMGGKVFDSNPAYAQMLGYTQKEVHDLYIWDWDRTHSKEELLAFLNTNAFKGGLFEVEQCRKDGTTINVEINSSRIEFAGKELSLCICRDITGRKKAEEEFKMASFSLENFSDAVLWTKENGEIFGANKAACNLYCYSMEELLLKTVPDINPQFTIDTWKEVKDKKKLRFEALNYTKFGTTFPVEITVNYLNYEGKEYNCAIIKDITEQKRSEKALRESEKKLSSMVTNIADVIAIVDKDGVNRYKSPNVEKWFGWKPEELVGNSALDLMHPDDITKTKEALYDISSEPKASINIEARYRCKGGEHKWTQFTAINLFDEPAINGFLVNYHDISARKASEKALLESKAQLRSLVDTAPDLVWLKDTNGVFLACNTRFESLYGAKEAKIAGNTDYDFVDKETADLFIGTDKKAIESGGSIIFEEQVIYADGHKEYLETIKSPVHDANGQLIGVLGVARDITQRKKSEEELKRASFSLENSSDPIFWKEKDGKICYVNKAACDLLDYSKEELLLMSIFEICPEATKAIWDQYWNVIKRDKIARGETELRTRTGKKFPVEVVSNYMNYEGKEYECSFMRDLTERRTYEKALEVEIKERHNLMEQSRDGIVILDTDGNVFETNPAYASMLGYSMKEMQSLHVWDWDFDYTKEQLQGMCRSIDEKGIYLETCQRRKNGEIINVEINSNSVELGDKKLILCVCRDMTQRKKEENELIEAKLTAEAASRVKDEFLATMSHELRTPLNSILGFSDILQSESFGEINEMQAEYLSYVSKSGKHLLEIINKILNLAKAESREAKLDYEIFYMAEVLDEIQMMLEPIALKKNIDIDFVSEPPIEMIEADKTKFKEIFFNLISNAIKFTPEKGNVEIDFKKLDASLYISVKDTGIGIAKEDMDKLFHPFTQLNPYLKHEYEGTGLGLAITKKFIEMHGGTIAVKSDLNKGSTFIFSIPLKAKCNDMN